MVMQTKEEINIRLREYRKRTGNIGTHRYEKTMNGFLMRKYRNMQSRVNGVQKLKSHLYRGLDLLDRQEFYRWSNSSDVFKKLFSEWKSSGYDRKLCPSVDRIDSSRGYHLSNMEWITHSENSRRGALSQKRKKKI